MTYASRQYNYRFSSLFLKHGQRQKAARSHSLFTFTVLKHTHRTPDTSRWPPCRTKPGWQHAWPYGGEGGGWKWDGDLLSENSTKC